MRSVRFVVSRLAVLLLSSMASLLLLELSLRIYRTLRYAEPLLRLEATFSVPIELDRDLGWKPIENYRSSSRRVAADGSSYNVTVIQGRHGFRSFGSLDS